MLQDLEFTGVMRFYYQAQDLTSGQKVGVFYSSCHPVKSSLDSNLG